MRIAWIDHALTFEREIISLVFEREYGLKLVSESSWEKFERVHGSVESYDGLLIHPGIKNQKDYVDRIRKLKIPVAIGTNSTNDYQHGEIPVLSYENKQSIVEFFRQRQPARS